ncbi:MAG: class I tRNA ligase family protein [Lentisphaeria bacterium]|nr:class I tRNA ligase family protein [Lentisphaeria bacterium]
MNKFYITTSVENFSKKDFFTYAYPLILGDVLCRYRKMMGQGTSFLITGEGPDKDCILNDLHIESVCSPQLNENIRKSLQSLFAGDFIYKKSYIRYRCNYCDITVSEKDCSIENPLCPCCKRKTEQLFETNYFFRAGNFQSWLVDYIKKHPDFILPKNAVKEILGFLREPLNDFCISQPAADAGIKFPFDADYVCQAFFLKILNTIVSIPEKNHYICLTGRNNLLQQTVYLPVILKALGMELPKQFQIHGLLKFPGHVDLYTGSDAAKILKMLKVSAEDKNAAAPDFDALRCFLMSKRKIGADIQISLESCIRRYNSLLSNQLGNLLNRVIKLTVQNFDSKIPHPNRFNDKDLNLLDEALETVKVTESHVESLQIGNAVSEIFRLIRKINRYIEENKTWQLEKSGNKLRLSAVVYVSIAALRIAGELLYPVMPEKITLLRKSLGGDSPVTFNSLKLEVISKPGSSVTDIGILFPKVVRTES